MLLMTGEHVVFRVRNLFSTTSSSWSSNSVTWIMHQSCFEQEFLMVVLKRKLHEDRNVFYCFVQLVDREEKAKKFSYAYVKHTKYRFNFLLKKKNSFWFFLSFCRLDIQGKDRRITFEATTTSIRQRFTEVAIKADCLIIDEASVRLFAINEDLHISCTIKTITEEVLI